MTPCKMQKLLVIAAALLCDQGWSRLAVIPTIWIDKDKTNRVHKLLGKKYTQTQESIDFYLLIENPKYFINLIQGGIRYVLYRKKPISDERYNRFALILIYNKHTMLK